MHEKLLGHFLLSTITFSSLLVTLNSVIHNRLTNDYASLYSTNLELLFIPSELLAPLFTSFFFSFLAVKMYSRSWQGKNKK